MNGWTNNASADADLLRTWRGVMMRAAVSRRASLSGFSVTTIGGCRASSTSLMRMAVGCGSGRRIRMDTRSLPRRPVMSTRIACTTSGTSDRFPRGTILITYATTRMCASSANSVRIERVSIQSISTRSHEQRTCVAELDRGRTASMVMSTPMRTHIDRPRMADDHARHVAPKRYRGSLIDGDV